jgi:hypothetical protein
VTSLFPCFEQFTDGVSALPNLLHLLVELLAGLEIFSLKSGLLVTCELIQLLKDEIFIKKLIA